jgi:alanyl-tRNA synthetase
MNEHMTGAEIRESFIQFFKEKKGHTFVPSSSLVPGGDQTLLFTNAGMVQFKDIFLGEEAPVYTRAVNSQKCLRVAGKHNDLDDVGRDNTHHTFFEMLGNWSFGDYYKAEAIAWAWELLTEVWGLDKTRLWTTTFVDELGEIAADEEAYREWRKQPGIDSAHILPFGRKDNFWAMADTGPCGPDSEIHYDLGLEFCDKQNDLNHSCQVNGDCPRFVEIWNLVFIQYNRTTAGVLVPLPKKHVDTGMGFERIVSILQGVYSNYKTDLFTAMFATIKDLAKHTDRDMQQFLTPYRVIADHARAAAFLIADGVVPGNTGRNYICRMIIRRAYRFGAQIGLTQPFMAKVAASVISEYGDFYKELSANQTAILDTITREEERFQKTLDAGLSQLEDLINQLFKKQKTTVSGEQAFDLYATHGIPFEITRDILRERGLKVSEDGFHAAMETHRLASGGGKAMGALGGNEAELFGLLFNSLVVNGKLSESGVTYDPYHAKPQSGVILAIVSDGQSVDVAHSGDEVDVVLPKTNFYLESGGQVSDTGKIVDKNGQWEIDIVEARKPAAGIITHHGVVKTGKVAIGDQYVLLVDESRRLDIMRNHTATHLLHAVLRNVLGDHARQAGSLVAPDRLRFDFTHPEALTPQQMQAIETGVNDIILGNLPLAIQEKDRETAFSEGVTALFGEKYGQTVRTVRIEGSDTISYELCGGTHVEETGLIGTFILLNESSVAAGIRRIEAVTGRKSYELSRKRFSLLKEAAMVLDCAPNEVPVRVEGVINDLHQTEKELAQLRQQLAMQDFESSLSDIQTVDGTQYLATEIANVSVDDLRILADRFRDKVVSGIAALATVIDEKPLFIVVVTDDLVKKGYHAGNLVKEMAKVVGGGGGGRPNLAQAGGRDASKLQDALAALPALIGQQGK